MKVPHTMSNELDPLVKDLAHFCDHPLDLTGYRAGFNVESPIVRDSLDCEPYSEPVLDILLEEVLVVRDSRCAYIPKSRVEIDERLKPT